MYTSANDVYRDTASSIARGKESRETKIKEQE
jgi:hypothetical protein